MSDRKAGDGESPPKYRRGPFKADFIQDERAKRARYKTQTMRRALDNASSPAILANLRNICDNSISRSARAKVPGNFADDVLHDDDTRGGLFWLTEAEFRLLADRLGKVLVDLPPSDPPEDDGRGAPDYTRTGVAVRRKAGITATVDALAWQVQEQTDELADTKAKLDRLRDYAEEGWRAAVAAHEKRADDLAKIIHGGMPGQRVAS